MSVNGTETEVMWCEAGHEYTRPKRHGRPRICDKHKIWFSQVLPNNYKVPARVLEGFELGEELLEEDGYVERWKFTWGKAVRTIAARAGTWLAVDVDQVEDYIVNLRLSELHRRIAEAEPYYRTSRGSVKEHPGWALSDRSYRKALARAKELGFDIGPEMKRKPVTSAEVYKTKLQSSAEESGELKGAVGPDGATL